MALDLIPYHKKNVLIIEDLAEMRSSMKSMLANMGVQQMETVNNGEEALAKLALNQYDIVFSDYELGRGKDGQQILEEVRYSGPIPAATVYIMVTAAQTVEMVMGALEFEPDGYITKPVTLEILRTRLNRIIRTKDVYREINRAIDKNDINGALEACNRLAVEKPKLALPAYRIKGKLLLGEKRYEEARDIYDTVLGIKRVAWAVLGMGKVEYFSGNYEAAQELLESLAKTKSKYVEAFDWLSKVLEAQGKFKAAQQVLQQAVEESPKRWYGNRNWRDWRNSTAIWKPCTRPAVKPPDCQKIPCSAMLTITYATPKPCRPRSSTAACGIRSWPSAKRSPTLKRRKPISI